MTEERQIPRDPIGSFLSLTLLGALFSALSLITAYQIIMFKWRSVDLPERVVWFAFFTLFYLSFLVVCLMALDLFLQRMGRPKRLALFGGALFGAVAPTVLDYHLGFVAMQGDVLPSLVVIISNAALDLLSLPGTRLLNLLGGSRELSHSQFSAQYTLAQYAYFYPLNIICWGLICQGVHCIWIFRGQVIVRIVSAAKSIYRKD